MRKARWGTRVRVRRIGGQWAAVWIDAAGTLWPHDHPELGHLPVRAAKMLRSAAAFAAKINADEGGHK